MRDGLCPHCGRVGRWTFSNYSVSYPPTGGDYTWAETDGKATCPHCQRTIKVRIRVDLDDHTVDQIVHSPFPTTDGWAYHVVAEIRRWADDDIQVKVMAFRESPEAAQTLLQEEFGGGFDVGYLRRVILQMSAAGYEELDGRSLHSSATKAIHYT